MGKVSGVRIAATGSYVPERIVTNEDLVALGCDSEWIIRRTGIRERRHAAAGQATSDLCYEAAVACMRQTDISADQIDLIIVATITPDHPTPSTACQLQHRLGSLAPAMDAPSRGKYLYWTVYTPAVVEPAMSEKFNNIEANRGRNGWGDFDLMIATFDEGLEGRKWILGDVFSAADVMLGSSAVFMRMFDMLPETKNIGGYADRCLARLAFQKATELASG